MATSDGKAYYRITALLKKIGVPYRDLIMGGTPSNVSPFLKGEEKSLDHPTFSSENFPSDLKVIISTRKERLSLATEGNVVCIEELGEDQGIAKARLLSILYPAKSGDCFIVGIDPGKRNGIAAFINHREVESSVMPSIEETILRTSKLLENAPTMTRKIVKIGYGSPRLALEIAEGLEALHGGGLSIQLVDERGTSTLTSSLATGHGRKYSFRSSRAIRKMRTTRDQRAARLIAFREGVEFQPSRIRA